LLEDGVDGVVSLEGGFGVCVLLSEFGYHGSGCLGRDDGVRSGADGWWMRHVSCTESLMGGDAYGQDEVSKESITI
jgi:hypothetical protein